MAKFVVDGKEYEQCCGAFMNVDGDMRSVRVRIEGNRDDVLYALVSTIRGVKEAGIRTSTILKATLLGIFTHNPSDK